MIIKNIYLSKSILIKPVKIKIKVCFYPANGAKKIAELFVKEGLTKANLMGAVKSQIPILVYDSSKIQNQLNHNFILKKYLPIYEKNDVLVPHIIETFPRTTISGQYTMSDSHRLLLDTNQEYLIAHSYVLARYILTMFGGKKIMDVPNILHRVNQLFTEDVFIKNYSYPKGFIQGNESLFALLQHWLSMDTYHLRFWTKYPSNLNISQKILSLSRNLELQVLLKTHEFKFRENLDEIRFLDSENNADLVLIKEYSPIIKLITKQEEPEALGQHIIGINKKIIYPIDVKLIKVPEINLPMFNGLSSMSPLYQGLLSANKLLGDLSVKKQKQPNFAFYNEEDEKNLLKIINNFKSGRCNLNIFNENYKLLTIDLYNNRIKTGVLFYENISYLPSIITSTFFLDENNCFQKLQKENPEFIHHMIKDISKTMDLKKYFPSYKEMKVYNFYENNLSFMLLLKKYNLLENYYTMRKLLLNIDIDV